MPYWSIKDGRLNYVRCLFVSESVSLLVRSLVGSVEGACLRLAVLCMARTPSAKPPRRAALPVG